MWLLCCRTLTVRAGVRIFGIWFVFVEKIHAKIISSRAVIVDTKASTKVWKMRSTDDAQTRCEYSLEYGESIDMFAIASFVFYRYRAHKIDTIRWATQNSGFGIQFFVFRSKLLTRDSKRVFRRFQAGTFKRMILLRIFRAKSWLDSHRNRLSFPPTLFVLDGPRLEYLCYTISIPIQTLRSKFAKLNPESAFECRVSL